MSSNPGSWPDRKKEHEESLLQTWEDECDSWENVKWIHFVQTVRAVFNECYFIENNPYPVVILDVDKAGKDIPGYDAWKKFYNNKYKYYASDISVDEAEFKLNKLFE